MIYVMSDIHGCFEEYQTLLSKINFREEDELYVLGDVVDKGPEPIKVLQDMMSRPNVYPVLGNHDYMALTVLKKLNVPVTEENCDTHLSNEDFEAVLDWQYNGGRTTMSQFSKLSAEEKEEILEYLQEFTLYEEVDVSDKKYILVHAGINDFSEDKELEAYALHDFIFFPADYKKQYYKDENTYLVTGHTPTFYIHDDKSVEIFCRNGHIALDCGCVYGKKLAAYCLDNGTVTYVDRVQKFQQKK